MRSGLALILCVVSLLAGCGGGGETPAPPISANPPPPPPLPPPPPPVIGAAGGTSTEASGASVIVPAGALTTDTTIRVAMDSTGAPALPAGLTGVGNTYVVTPHGGDFAAPIEVSIPAPAVNLLPTQRLMLAKAQPGGAWTLLDDTVLENGKLKASVNSFSYFMSVVVTYTLPIAQFVPLTLTARLTCGPQDCEDAVGPVNATYTVTGNGGQVPANCPGGELVSNEYDGRSFGTDVVQPLTGFTITKTVDHNQLQFTFMARLRCPGSTQLGGSSYDRQIRWQRPASYPSLSVVRAENFQNVLEGYPARIEVMLSGGAVKYVGNPDSAVASTPTITDHAVIEWERSDDNASSWRTVAHSYQYNANPSPYGTGLAWRPWSVSTGIVVTAADQRALYRVHACYTPPAGIAAPPCVTSPAKRINVLQQSEAPAITSAPRPLLIRTGQTASLSATVAGAPAPTLQWQSRPANSNDAWSNVTTGDGATTANYNTAALALSDNGTQYRVVATNAVGSTASTAVTVSVSDVDVAPSIATQPANLNVASGSDAVFAVDARGTEALSYQWYRSGTALAGENSPILRLSAVNLLNSGSFSVSVSNAAGSVTSNAATLNVYPGTPAAVAPTIVTQPASLDVNVGNTATFAVGVDGSGPFTFQWRRNGFNIPGATKAVLILPAVVSDASGTYSVIVSNSVGPAVTSVDASLSVSSGASAEAPEITTQPATLIVAPGGSGILAVAASGSGPLSYQWLNDGVPMGGVTDPVMYIDNATENDEGRYSVRVSNHLGEVVSTEVQVILLGAPYITQSPPDRTVVDGGTTQFSVTAGGSHLRYQWLRNGLAIPGETLSYYNSPAVYVADSGAVYSVIVSNGAGIQVSAPAVLTVIAFVAPTVIADPTNTTIVAGTAATICATFGGSPPFEVQMTRWSGTAWAPVLAARRIDDNQPACTTTPVLQLGDNGAQFRFEAIAGPGQAYSATTNPATITVTAPSAVTTTLVASRATSGVTANNRSGQPSVSADGNLVAFISDGTNLVPNFNGDAFTAQYAYVRNLTTGVTTLINQKLDGTRSSTGVNGLKLAAGGRYAIFSSLAGDLVADDTNGSQDVFVRDLQTGTTRRVSLRADGTESPPSGNGVADMHLDISADGAFISFMSSQDLIGDDPSGAFSLYFRSINAGFLQRVASTNAAGTVGHSALSGDGEHLAYLYATFSPGAWRNAIINYDTEASAATEVFSIDSTNNASYVAQGIDISSNGRYITFPVRSPTMFNGSTFTQVLALDRQNPNHITIVSGDSNGFGDGHSIYPKVSDDGKVLFFTNAGNLTGGFANAVNGTLVVRDLQGLQGPQLANAARRSNGTPVYTIPGYDYHALSSDGTAVAFVSSELDVAGSGINEFQVFVAPRP